ncbi:unnamed protein product [Rotaria sp. Silwood2]|nr:unnamed protein product [Rotaria sp. Silwood2]CAF2970064.1 unnamed protein product [Rotaria sp. Silwood2]CAF3185954.1 unnamed protein product [Rotaria sp. Silwood2]CAF3319905.1 unnamed protein product [Rotaria sp. Silwood2]CAF4133839.1 unnamed protein product [Rotaria sp. Silwood2]
MNRLLGNKRRASFDVNQRPLSFKVYYLGNVATSLTRGDGCADRPAKILWDMHIKNQGRLGRKLRLTITNGGLQADSYTKTETTNDITIYCTNRIAYYFIADKLNPKMFIWVYRHVNVRSGLTTELRCHACLCSSENDAKSLSDSLHHQLQDSLREYVREKHRRQISRLSMISSLNLTNIDKTMNEPPKRLLTRSQASNYRPSLARSMSNIGLGRMDDIEENDDELTSEATTMSTSSTSSIDLITSKFTDLHTDKKMKLYAHALSDIL